MACPETRIYQREWFMFIRDSKRMEAAELRAQARSQMQGRGDDVFDATPGGSGQNRVR